MKPPEQIKPNLIRNKRIRGSNTRHPHRPEDEDEPFPINVPYATPQQEEAPKRKGVGRYDPLLTTFRNVEMVAYGGENNDDALNVEDLFVAELVTNLHVVGGDGLH